VLAPWVGVLAATILFIGTNAGIIGVSRLAFSLGQHRQLPRMLGRVHPTRLTPYAAIVLFGVIAVILILPGEIPLLADLYAFGSMISFTAAHVSVIVLRRKEPDLERPFRAPLNVRLGGTTLPLTAVFGAMGTIAVWGVIVAYKPWSGFIGIAWVGVGLVAYVIFRKAQGYSLTATVRTPTLPSSLQEDVVYDQLLVPLRDTQVSDEMMVLACQLATEKGATVDVVYVVEVPMNLPMDAPMARERERGRRVLDVAMAVAAEFGVEAWPHLIPARRAGRAIVETAEEWDCDVVVIGSPRKLRSDARLVGATVEYVMRNAPGEVLLNLVPHDYPMESSVDQQAGPDAEGAGQARRE
jgi:APA family basic amino acid/polyamine antiporter